jgi:hypothetical protein
MKTLPTLYNRRKSGALQEWTMEITGNKYRVVFGQVGGKRVTSKYTVALSKNDGKSNATTGAEQALLEAQRAWDKQVESGYVTDINSATIGEVSFTEPMLAHTYGPKTVLTYPVYSQPKLDGCLDGDTVVSTDIGDLTIGDIVNNGVECMVKTYNEKTRKKEYKEIVNRFKNGVDINETSTQWYELELTNGKTLKVTGNHKIYLPRLQCWRRVDELQENDILLLE